MRSFFWRLATHEERNSAELGSRLLGVLHEEPVWRHSLKLRQLFVGCDCMRSHHARYAVLTYQLKIQRGFFLQLRT